MLIANKIAILIKYFSISENDWDKCKKLDWLIMGKINNIDNIFIKYQEIE